MTDSAALVVRNTTEAAAVRIGLIDEEYYDDVKALHHVSYRIVLPIILVVGVCVNSLCLIVLTRPRLWAMHVNTYFLLLASSDLLIFIISFATVITLNGCELCSYNVALYFAHSSFTLFYITQTFTLYIILWISYDRFLAVWDSQRFYEIQQPGVLRNRLVVTLLVCIAIHLKHLFEVDVYCRTEDNQDDDNTCHSGVWAISDSLHHLNRKAMWRQMFWVVRGLIVLVIPIVLVLVLNIGIVIGIIRHRRHSSVAASVKNRGRDLSRIYTILAISFTFITCTVPVTVHASIYAENIDVCHGPYSEEVFRAVANMLLLLEHITHFIFLSISETFINELNGICNIFNGYLRTKFSRQSSKRDTGDNLTFSTESQSGPVFYVSSSETYAENGANLEVGSSSESSSPENVADHKELGGFLSVPIMSSSLCSSKLTLPEPPSGRSCANSTITLEEVF